MKNKKEPIVLYDDSGSREDMDIYLQRIEELEDQNRKVSGLLVKLCLSLVILLIISIVLFKFLNDE
ncbi:MULTISPECIES: hypothetical protein [Staphylococcus]|uniref:Uncharacterized protein n=2 Tax=Staphylococcus TaxID=1279 RepID=A0AAQ0MG74_9STAP|nr:MULTISPECIES: hypothetical protein [Staphylococcus]PTI57302.1 hypothetical protein BU103_09660 [Staphylococcus xylosus]MCE5003737.1 hypothetical protein [Staphylococcus pseudoxylosus]MDW8544593.1 hypothetical protein [Staphylococcus pseudoxylosus]MDW8568887.1 hypothetical protein [Staphylococcus shinii]MDW8568893.1 hypothetical protein [Staphylococcus shinii]